MAMKIQKVSVRTNPNGSIDIQPEVWLDDSKTIPDPLVPTQTIPDPSYVRVIGVWNKPSRMKKTARQYFDDPTVRQSMRDAAAAALAGITPTQTIASAVGATL